MRILLIEGWLHGSHRRWAEGYRRASGHEVDIVGLPAGSWRWTLRGGAQALADSVAEWTRRRGQPDVLLISGTVDAAHLLGLTRRALTGDPAVVVYQHESQLVYPGRRASEEEAALRNWLSWCAADLVVFNSHHHRHEVEAALPTFLGRWPEPSPALALDEVRDRFEVLPVGVDVAALVGATPTGRGTGRDPVILWPHRWERDKDPGAFVRALEKVRSAGLAFGLVLAGEDPPGDGRHVDAARNEVVERFADQLVAVGPFDDATYRNLLPTSDIVVSCAHHEFFGIAVVEAIAAGCRPVLPAALAYPEVVPDEFHDRALYRPGHFGTALVDAVAEHHRTPWSAPGLARSMLRFDWAAVAHAYDQRLEALVGERAAGGLG